MNYKDMTAEEKVPYLERRLADTTRAAQSATDTLRATSQELALLSLKLDAAAVKAHEAMRPKGTSDG